MPTPTSPAREQVRAALFQAWHRTHNRVLDVLAVLAGYCNHRPWSPIPGGGGYAHWRCGRKRGHIEMHRSRNYVWSNDGRTSYVPVPVLGPNQVGKHWAAQPRRWERHLIPTRRQARAQRRWMQEQPAARRSERGGGRG